jgi:penicillin-binding protein 1A
VGNVAGRTDTAGPKARSDEQRRRLLGRPWVLALLVLTTVGVLAAATAALAFYRVYEGATIPSEDELVVPDPTLVLDHAGETVQTLEPAAIRENVSIDDLPQHVPDAVLAAEDRRFYEHRGFSARGIVRAAWANLTAGEVVQGASTIHQQYVAMAVADIDDSYTGKFREVAIAARLDDEFSKDRILEMYLNSVPFGRSAYGIQAAARTYFDVDAVDLDLEEAAVLAGMIAAPTAFDPERNPEGASARRDFVLGGMVEIDAVDAATAEDLRGTELPELRTEPLFAYGPDAYFLDEVRDRVSEVLDDDRDFSTGLRVHTTLDRTAQQLAHDSLREHLGDAADSGAVVTVDSATGAVRTLLGGADYETQQFNVATDGLRQIGSSFKTFALAELVDQGFDPDDSEVDAPREYEVETDTDTATIGNYSGRGHGEVSVREATVESINTAYVILSEELGHDNVVEMANRLGIRQEITPVPSSVLGTADLTTLEVTAAYATLGAEGVRHDPYLIERIESHDGEVLFEHEPDPDEVLDPNTAAVVTDVLVDVVERGTGTAAAIDHPVAGKTGTTNDFRDAWFVGYTPTLTTSVWIGNRDNTPMDGVAGGSIPAVTWSVYMGQLLEGTDVTSFPAPDPSDLEPFEELDATDDEDDLPTPSPAPETTAEPEPSPDPEPEPTPEDETPEDETPEDETPEDETPEGEGPEDEDPADGEADEDDGLVDEVLPGDGDDDGDGNGDDGNGDGDGGGNGDGGDGNGGNDGDDDSNDGDDDSNDGGNASGGGDDDSNDGNASNASGGGDEGDSNGDDADETDGDDEG